MQIKMGPQWRVHNGGSTMAHLWGLWLQDVYRPDAIPVTEHSVKEVTKTKKIKKILINKNFMH